VLRLRPLDMEMARFGRDPISYSSDAAASSLSLLPQGTQDDGVV
jgi:hypothetical protein